jgi:DNA-binding Xre family transcriptional regulator
MKDSNVGSNFDDFLKEDGIYEEVRARALKRVIAMEVADIMKREHMTKTTVAKAMETSRSQLDRILDPKFTGVTLETLDRVAQALGKRMTITFA